MGSFSMSSSRPITKVVAAVRVNAPRLTVPKDKVVLHTDLQFWPKVTSTFHMNQDIILAAFFPGPSTPLQPLLLCLDVCRALAFYMSCTQQLCHTSRLFIRYNSQNKGDTVLPQRLSKWISSTISLACEMTGLDLPTRPHTYPMRAQATPATSLAGIPLHDICKAATWSTPSTFIRHYRFDIPMQDYAFGRAIFLAVLQ
ncbi:putative oxidoreductase OrdL [Varanus komodoensis]|nr:putative oxidoreductase OrdL [Varanus komodoensis]